MKYLARLINRMIDSHTISSIKDANGLRKFNAICINEVFKGFYSQGLIDRFMSELTFLN